MSSGSESIPGYAYGAEAVPKSSISLQELAQMKGMHQAWCKSLQLQISLSAGLYARLAPNEW